MKPMANTNKDTFILPIVGKFLNLYKHQDHVIVKSFIIISI